MHRQISVMMANRVFKRKIYDRLLQWKQESGGTSAALIQGARRIGKSTIVEEFARNEYTSYLLIDFNRASAAVKALFDDLHIPCRPGKTQVRHHLR